MPTLATLNTPFSGGGSLYGPDAPRGQQLSPEAIAAGRQWINTRGHGDGQQFSFDNGDFANFLASGNGMEARSGHGWGAGGDLLSAGLAAGYDANALAQITGVPVENVQRYMDGFSGTQNNHMSVSGAAALGYMDGDPNALREFVHANNSGGMTPGQTNRYVGWSGGRDGGLTYDSAGARAFVDARDGEGSSPASRALFASRRAQRGRGDNIGTGGMPPTGTAPPGPNLNAPTLNRQYTPNPYLTDQIRSVGDQISRQFNEQILPGIRSSAITNNVFGSAKSQLAEGRAAGDASRAFNDASMQLLGQDYGADAARNLQRYQADQGYDLGRGNLSLGYVGENNRYALGREGLDVQRYGIDTGANTQRYLGNLSADTQRYGIQSGAETQRYLGDQSAGTQRYLGDQNTGLGYYQAGNQYRLGQGQLANQRYLGDQSTGLGYYQAGNNYLLGQGQLANQRYATDQSTGLGWGQIGNQRYGMDQNFYLGNQGQMQNFYTQQRGQDLESLRTGAALYGTGTQGEWSPYTNLSSVYGPYSGYSQNTSTSQGFDYSRAIGNGFGIYQGLTAGGGR